MSRQTQACPAISIIVPLFNKAPYIERALRSILAQDFEDYEVIVIDDGSTDDGPARVEALSYDPRIRMISQSNAGPGAARNRGIAEARGTILAFLDADDEWMPRYLGYAFDALRSHPDASAVTTALIDDPPGRSTAPQWRRRGITPGMFEALPGTRPTELLTVVAFMTTTATVARTEAVRSAGGFYEHQCRYGEDASLMLKLALREKLFLSLDTLAIYHREHSALNRHDRGLRPIEPFLVDTADIEAATPVAMRTLMHSFLSARALKTACVLTYWGRWREGRSLLRRFRTRDSWRLPLFAPAMLGVNPFGALGSALWRASRARLETARP